MSAGVSFSGNAAELFHEAAQRFPHRTALVQDGATVTFAALLEAVQARAAQMRRCNMAEGSKVLLFVPMSVALYRDVLALLYLGACPVFLDQWVSRARLRAALETVPPDAMIATPLLRFFSFFLAPLRRIKRRVPSGLEAGHETVQMPVAVRQEATALVTFTTGSTGTPKAADRTHAFLRAQYGALKPHLEAASGPVLTLLPIVVLINLAMGLPTLLPPKGFKAATHGKGLLRTLGAAGPRTLVGSPAPLLELARAALEMRESGVADETAHIRHVLTGGGAVWPDEAAGLIRAFPQAAVRVVYGSTEAEPIASIAAEDLAAAGTDVLARYGLPVGRVDRAARVAIIPPDQTIAGALSAEEWEAIWVQPSIVGEIVVAGAHVLRAYLANPAAIKRYKVDVDGIVWHRTGDLGRLETDGRLYLLGRVEEMLLVEGKPVYPMIAERLFRMESGAEDAALVRTSAGTTMAVVGGEAYDAASARQVLEELGLGWTHLEAVRRIPKDPRHRTKVDRASLARMVKGTG